MLARLELVTQHLSPDEGKTRKETVSPAFQGRGKKSKEGLDKKRAGEFHLSPLIPLLKPLTSARLLLAGVRCPSSLTSSHDSEASEAKKQAWGRRQSLSLKQPSMAVSR